MDDPRTAEGVEHLQTAARELLKAARSFLDVVEDVVEDPERIGGVASGLAELFTGALKRTPAPWERSAWGDDGPGDDRPHEDAPREDAPREDAHGEDSHDDLLGPDEPSDESPEVVEEPAEVAEEPAARPARSSAPRRRAPASRVRRIAVD